MSTTFDVEINPIVGDIPQIMCSPLRKKRREIERKGDSTTAWHNLENEKKDEESSTQEESERRRKIESVINTEMENVGLIAANSGSEMECG